MSFRYPADLRRKVLDLVAAARPVATPTMVIVAVERSKT